MAKVLFINPVVKEEDNPYHVPMGIAQLAAIVIKLNHQVQIFDLNAWRVGDDKIKEVLTSDNWDLIAVGGITTSYSSIKKIVKICTHNVKLFVIISKKGENQSTTLDRNRVTNGTVSEISATRTFHFLNILRNVIVLIID